MHQWGSGRWRAAAWLAALILVSWLALTGPFILSVFASGGVSQPAALYLSGLTDADLALAAIDDLQPTAAEQRDDVFRVFFSDRDARNRALGFQDLHQSGTA